MRALGLLVIASGCMTPVMRFGGPTARQAQHETLGRVTPPALAVDGAWKGNVTTAKVRVWADDDFRAQNMHWQQTFQEQLDDANEVMASQFGVRFEPEFRQWDHHAPDAVLATMLGELAAKDPGTDVTVVIGLTSSLGLVSGTFDQLGIAELPGNHLVIRGYADQGERAAFDAVFTELEPKERTLLHQARRRHKSASIVLHELAHNFGAPHQQDSTTLMNPNYSTKAASFDDETRAIISASLDRRLHRATKRDRDVAPTGPAEHPTLAIVVDATGRPSIGGNPIDDETLDGLFAVSFDDDHETEVVIKVAKGVPQAAVVKMIDRAKAKGLHRVSMVRN